LIRIVGLGPGVIGQLPLENHKILQEADNLWLRTEQHPVVKELISQGLHFNSFDKMYDKTDDFSELYTRIAEEIKKQNEERNVTYAVPGHPLVAEETVRLLMRDSDLNVQVFPAMSCLDSIFSAVGIDPVEGLIIEDALRLNLNYSHLDTTRGTVVLQVYNQTICSDLKLTLMDAYPDEFKVCLIRGAGIPNLEKVEWLPLYQIDRRAWVDYLTALFIPPLPGAARAAKVPLDSLTEIMEVLRSENGCPWDKSQSHQSLKRYVIEEAYEVVEAIDSQDMYKLCEELGDLLLQVVFHAQIAQEQDNFNIKDVIDVVVSKMVRRHPHVFGKGHAETPDQVKETWEEIKELERMDNNGKKPESIINVPLVLPSLMLAEKVQAIVSRVGFDWKEPQAAFAKIKEEVLELEDALAEGKVEAIQEEMGDFLFATVNVARLLELNPEEVLKQAVDMFIGRFHYIESKSRQTNTLLKDLSLIQMEEWWQESKING